VSKIEPFDKNVSQYEDWFTRNKFAYESELHAIRVLLPIGDGLEVGVGSGRFAASLGVKLGVDPSIEMMKIARKKGLEVINGVGEQLPLRSSFSDFVLIVTTICFFDDVHIALQETFRILKSGGSVVIGFIDRESPVGKLYQKYKDESTFYKVATFYTVNEVVSILTKIGFKNFKFVQTIFNPLPNIKAIEPVKDGFGEGSFVVVKAIKL